MVKINKIILQTCEAFSPDDKSLGFLNYFEFLDFKIQIKEKKLVGYYMLYNNEKIYIDEDGRCDSYPKGFYDLVDIQLDKLIQ